MSTVDTVLEIIEENAKPFITKPQIVTMIIRETNETRKNVNRKVSRALTILINRKKQIIHYYPKGATEPRGYCLRDNKITL
jgi:hypothetical protein